MRRPRGRMDASPSRHGGFLDIEKANLTLPGNERALLPDGEYRVAGRRLESAALFACHGVALDRRSFDQIERTVRPRREAHAAADLAWQIEEERLLRLKVH